MKVRITTLLSLTGVFVAGSAAALVNTQVLSSTALRKSTASEISVADTEAPTSATSPTTGTEVGNKFAPLASSLTPSSPQTTFDVSPAGTVVLNSAGGVLAIVAVNPAAGWGVAQSEVDDGKVEVKLQSATQLVEFTASLVAGQIVTSTEVTDLTVPSVSRPTRSTVAGTPNTTKEPQRPGHDQTGKGEGGGGDNHSGNGGGGSDD